MAWLKNINFTVWLVRLAGLMAVFVVPLQRLPFDVDVILPFDLERTSHLLAIIVGLVLIYLSTQIGQRKYAAYVMAVCLLATLLIAELLRLRSPLEILLYTLALANVIYHKREFVVKSSVISIKRGIFVATSMLLVSILLVSAMFVVLDQNDFGRRITTKETASLTFNSLLGKPLPSYVHPTRRDAIMIDAMRLTMLISLAIVLYSLFRPYILSGEPSRSDRIRALKIIEKYGITSEEYFKYWPADKYYFFNKQSVIAYGVSNGVAVVLDGAIGSKKSLTNLRKQFLQECHINDWTVAVLHCGQAEAEAWEELGLRSVYIGSEAVVDVETFLRDSVRNKHFRYVTNKALEQDLDVKFWSPPLTNDQIKILSGISSRWLSSSNRREYAFIMGAFDTDYIGECRIAVLVENGIPIGYANFIPTYVEGLSSIDHMRSIPGVSSIAMHFLLLNILQKLGREKAKSLNLGLAPLSKMEDRPTNMVEKLLTVLKRIGQRYYSFKGLEQFKGKFSPDWQPSYISYEGRPTALISIANAINDLTSYKKARSYPRWIIPTATVSAILFAAFPLAWWLNPPYAWRGLVSALGQYDRPYAWVFNACDIMSSILFALVMLWLIVNLNKFADLNTKKVRLAAKLIFIGCFANIAAAVIPLPAGVDSQAHISLAVLTNPNLIAHAVASLIGGATYIMAAVLWYKVFGKKTDSKIIIKNLGKYLLDWRLLILVAQFLFITVGYAFGQIDSNAGAIIQRAFIVLTAIWMVLFTKDGLTLVRPPKP